TVRAECCEALVGAVYLAWGGADGGLHAVRQWLDPQWQRSCLELASDPHRHNWKSALQELTQAQQAGLPSYATTEENSNHGDQRRFRSVVSVNAKEKGCGWGPSRRLAEQEAAREALEQLKPPSGS
ncbi:MAG: putative dsRNA-binding protein, partial [Prochlorococcaceae cyanobacterium]